MKIRDFLTEQWMNEYERQARFNLTDTSVQAWSAGELLEKEPEALEHLVLDYGYIPGDPALRKEVLSLYQDQREETLTFCHGALQGNTMIADILLSPGDHVITIAPGYQQFVEYPIHKGASVDVVELDEENGWSLDLDKVRQALRPQTKMLFFANPSNPTGTWTSGKAMEELIELCRMHDLWLVCDEVYLVPDGHSLSVSDLYEKAVVTGSLSKQYGLPGLRFGWIKGAPDVIAAIDVYRDYTIISCGPLVERMALIALRQRASLLQAAAERIARNKAVLQSWLASSPNFSCHLPEKGSVAFLKIPDAITDSADFARQLLEQTGIFFVPGACFGKEGYVRMGLGQDIDGLESVLQTLEEFTRTYLEEQRG